MVAAVRPVWPERLPLWVRISETDWKDGGWTGDDSVKLAAESTRGVDLIDCSSGGSQPTRRSAGPRTIKCRLRNGFAARRAS